MIPPRRFSNRMAAVGRIYRSNIVAGLTISVNSNYPTPVPLRDPLAQLPGAVETLLYGKQELYVDDVLTFDAQDMNTFPVILDEHMGAPAQIVFARWPRCGKRRSGAA